MKNQNHLPRYYRLGKKSPLADEMQEIISDDGTLTGASIRTLANAAGQYLPEWRERHQALILAAPQLLEALRGLVITADNLTDGQIDPKAGKSQHS